MSVVEIKNLKGTIAPLVNKVEYFKIRLNSGGWKGNIYVPVYVSKLEHLEKDNVIIFSNHNGSEWKIGYIKNINDNMKEQLSIGEINRKVAVNITSPTRTIEFNQVVCRIKKVYGSPKKT